jgi:hypothetical protein
VREQNSSALLAVAKTRFHGVALRTLPAWISSHQPHQSQLHQRPSHAAAVLPNASYGRHDRLGL